MGRELEVLRAQVAKLSRTRDQKNSEQQTSAKCTGEEATRNSAEQEATEILKSDEEDLVSHIEDLVKALEEEIKETNPITLLVVFVLGIVIGRLLPTR